MNDSTLPPDQRVKDGGNRVAKVEADLPQPKGRNPNKPKNQSASSSFDMFSGPRRKVPPKGLKKGFALHDWMDLQRVSKDLAQRKGAPHRAAITAEEIRQHNDVHDAWISLRGKVYNITPYLHYHPGGVDIFKSVLGKDASVLFDKYHRWVNIDGLVGCLMLGFLAPPSSSKGDDADNDNNKDEEDDEDETDRNTNGGITGKLISIHSPLSGPRAEKKPLSNRSLGSAGSDGSFEFHIPAPRAPSQLQHMPHLLKTETTESRLDDDKNPWEKAPTAP